MIKELGKVFTDEEVDRALESINYSDFNEQALQFPYSHDKSLRIASLDICDAFLHLTVNNILGESYTCWYKKLHPKSAFGGESVYFHQESRFVISWGYDPSDFVQCFVALSDLDYCPIVVAEYDSPLEHGRVLSKTGISKDIIKISELEKIPKNKFKTYYLRKGEVLLFDYFAIHGSVANISAVDQPRGVFQFAKRSVIYDKAKMLPAAEEKLDWEIDVLEKMLENRKQQKENPVIV